ncbi:hypothetical protein ACFCXK_34070 [Streptomyces sp. NPDC056269]|uniref:hypothetical protein n=1 Tax=Streptomyces sp. NPDC056269 TaxID=3345768 RepID=UPI0035D52E7F
MSKALSPADLGGRSGALRARAGVEERPVQRMNAQANTGRLSDEARHTDNSVDDWLSGSHFPRLYLARDTLINALGATDEEKTAFYDAYARIARRESDAFKEAYPRIERLGDESFDSASRRVTLAEALARLEAAQHESSAPEWNVVRIEAERTAHSLGGERPHAVTPAPHRPRPGALRKLRAVARHRGRVLRRLSGSLCCLGPARERRGWRGGRPK